MKKLACFILTVICALSFAMFLTACGTESDTSAGLKVRNIDGVYTVVGYAEEKDASGNTVTELSVSEYITSDGVSHKIGAIKTGAFKGNTSLKKVSVGDSVKEIGSGAFANMTALETLSLPFIGRKIVAYDNERLLGYVFGTTEYNGGYSVTQSYNDSNSITVYFPETLQNVNISNTFSAYADDDEPVTSYTVPKYAFNNMLSLSSVTFNVGDSVTAIDAIGDYAFYGCSGIKSFVLPDTVETIGEGAFYKCFNLNAKLNVTGTDGADFTYGAASVLTTIKNKAFYSAKFTEVVLPATVTEIGEFAFASEENEGEIITNGQSKITSLTLGDAVETIGRYAFYRCDKLKTVTLGTATQKIGQAAFARCSSLESVGVSGVLTNELTLEAWSFYGCAKLKEFADNNAATFPAAVKYVGADAFNGCVNLPSPTFAAASVTIYDRAFANCSSVTDAAYTGTASDSAFEGSPIGLQFTLTSGVYYVSDYDNAASQSTSVGVLEEIVVPAEYNGIKVAGINNAVFKNCTSLKSVIISDNVISIGDEAFNGCTALEKVVFGKNIQTIGKNVLTGTAYADAEENYAGGSLYVGTYLVGFDSTSAVTAVVVKDGTVAIAAEAFVSATAVTSVTVASSVKYIGENAFNGLTGLVTVYIDGADVASACTASNSCGGLLANATTVYVKASIYEGNIGSYITDNYAKGDKVGGYYKYE